MRGILVAAFAALFSVTARAQTVETPVPFDSSQRVLAVTPTMATRLGLRAPAWPVSGEYREARLYSVSPVGGFTLVVLRPTGALERFSLTAGDRTALGGAIDSALVATGRSAVVASADTVSEPAGNAFARRLTILSAIAYGPLAASLADDGRVAGGLYLLTTGLTYFISYGASQSTQFTRAQSDLAGDLGLAGAAAGILTGYAISGETEKGVRAAGLAGALIGTLTGAQAAKGMSDAEAHSVVMGIESGAAFGVLAASQTNEGQAIAIGAVAGGALGYPLGYIYPRKAGYTVTAGDAESIGTTALIGAAWAGATLQEDVSTARIAATLGAGYIAGAFVGERLLARRFNLSRTQSNVLKIGAVAGGLVGLAVPLFADEPGPGLTLGSIAAGATVGVAALASSFPPNSRATKVDSLPPSSRGLRLSISPFAALAAANRAVGKHAIVRLSF